MGDTITGRAIDIITHLMDSDKNILWDLSLHKSKKKRSLSSNKYYWNLVDEMALKTHIPKNKIHNGYLREVGIREMFGGKACYMLLPDDDDTENQVLLSSTYHLAPLRQTKVGTDKKRYRWYVMLKGSSDFMTDEMNMLVDLAVQDAKQLGIETMTPQELAHIRELEKANEEKRNKQHSD